MRTVADVKADILGCVRRGEHEMEAGFPYENPLNDYARELILGGISYGLRRCGR